MFKNHQIRNDSWFFHAEQSIGSTPSPLPFFCFDFYWQKWPLWIIEHLLLLLHKWWLGTFVLHDKLWNCFANKFHNSCSLGSDGGALLFSGLPFLYSSLFQSICITTILLVTDWGYEFRNFCSSSHPSSNSSMCFKILLVVVHFWFWFTFVKFDNLSLLLPFLLLRRGGGWKWNEILNFLVFVIPLVLLLLLFLLKLLMMKLWQNYFPPRENRLTNWI